MPLYRVEEPAADVVSLADMKEYLRVDHDDDDLVIEAIGRAVIQRLDGSDGYLRRALVSQIWDYKLSCFPSCGNYIRLPLPPLIDVISVKHIDKNGAEQTVSESVYHVAGLRGQGRISLRDGQAWPDVATAWPDPITIRYVAGYVDVSASPTGNVPEPIIQAVKMTSAHLYDNRQSVVIGSTAVEVPYTAQWLLWPYRVFD